MAVRIRLQRHGRKKRPFYRLVAADARAQRDGVFLERLGHYNPMTEPADVFIDEEKALKWLRRGAQPSDTAKRLLTQNGILMKFEYEKLGKPMPGEEVVEEVEKTDDPEPTETQETAPEANASLAEASPDAEEASEAAAEEE